MFFFFFFNLLFLLLFFLFFLLTLLPLLVVSCADLLCNSRATDILEKNVPKGITDVQSLYTRLKRENTDTTVHSLQARRRGSLGKSSSSRFLSFCSILSRHLFHDLLFVSSLSFCFFFSLSLFCNNLWCCE